MDPHRPPHTPLPRPRQQAPCPAHRLQGQHRSAASAFLVHPPAAASASRLVLCLRMKASDKPPAPPAARRAGQAQSILKEGQQMHPSLSAAYGASLEAERGDTASPGGMNILVRASQPPHGQPHASRAPSALLSFSFPYISPPLLLH